MRNYHLVYDFGEIAGYSIGIPKALDKTGVEFGRASLELVADAGQAKYLDFVFDRRTNIDRNDRVRLE